MTRHAATVAMDYLREHGDPHLFDEVERVLDHDTHAWTYDRSVPYVIALTRHEDGVPMVLVDLVQGMPMSHRSAV